MALNCDNSGTETDYMAFDIEEPRNADQAGVRTRRIPIDAPEWLIEAIDREARRRGIPRQALIKTWLVDKIDRLEKKRTG